MVPYRGPGFDAGIEAYFTSKGGQAVSEILNERRHNIGDTQITSRVINHWQSMGLIDESRESSKGWRKFSLLEAVWLGILMELRGFGFPLEMLAKVKTSLEGQYLLLPKTKRRVSFFEYYVSLALLRRMPVYLLVFSDGTAEPVYFDQLVASLQHTITKHHVTLSLNGILQQLFPKRDLSPLLDRTLEVSDEEAELLLLLRTGNYDSVTVKRKNGRIERIDVEETIDLEKRITDILKEGDFQDIEIRQANGKVVSVKRTVKKKITE